MTRRPEIQMLEFIELHHARPPIEPDANHDRPLSRKEYARLVAPRPSLLAWIAAPFALFGRLKPKAQTLRSRPAHTRTITAKLAP